MSNEDKEYQRISQESQSWNKNNDTQLTLIIQMANFAKRVQIVLTCLQMSFLRFF